jgi:S-adenosylmethionine synthetase
MHKKIREDIRKYLIPRIKKSLPKRTEKLFGDDIKYHINPTGKFVIGGPHGDTGLTGRKIIVDTYGGKGAHGGGAFSGKDPSKVDRSAAYGARHIAKNLVAAGVADQGACAGGLCYWNRKTCWIICNHFGTTRAKDQYGNIYSDGKIAGLVQQIFDMRPYAIVDRLQLKNPIYSKTAAYGHMGRRRQKWKVQFGKKRKNQIP